MITVQSNFWKAFALDKIIWNITRLSKLFSIIMLIFFKFNNQDGDMQQAYALFVWLRQPESEQNKWS